MTLIKTLVISFLTFTPFFSLSSAQGSMHPICGEFLDFPIQDPNLPTLTQNRIEQASRWIQCVQRTDSYLREILNECSTVECIEHSIINLSLKKPWKLFLEKISSIQPGDKTNLLDQCGVRTGNTLTSQGVKFLTQCIQRQFNISDKELKETSKLVYESLVMFEWACELKEPFKFSSLPKIQNKNPKTLTDWIENYNLIIKSSFFTNKIFKNNCHNISLNLALFP